MTGTQSVGLIEQGQPESVGSQPSVDSPTLGRHNCGVTTEPLRNVRDHLSEIVDRVEREHDRVVITRNGREAAVLLSAADLAELEETLSVLSDPQAMADIREADASYDQGEVIRGVDAVRALRS
jgi:antitoxin YefM